MAAPQGDAERGPSVDFQLDAHPNDEKGELGEYGQLVRYISTYKDGRRASMSIAAEELEQPKKRRFWQKKQKGPSGEGFDTPEGWLATDMKQGLSNHEVEQRRKKTGWNELSTEKENLFLKFLGFFTGPILYGMSMLHSHCSQL